MFSPCKCQNYKYRVSSWSLIDLNDWMDTRTKQRKHHKLCTQTVWFKDQDVHGDSNRVILTTNVDRTTVSTHCAFCCELYYGDCSSRWDALSCWEVDPLLNGLPREENAHVMQDNILFMICNDCRGLGVEFVNNPRYKDMLVKLEDECTLFEFDSHFGINY